MDRNAAEAALSNLGRRFERTWRRMRAESFAGQVTIETANTTYRFIDGAFVAKAARVQGRFPAWELPPEMMSVELLGFLYEERGVWSVSTNWREGALAVLGTSRRSLALTSPTEDFVQDTPTTPTIRIRNPSDRRTHDASIRRSA